MGHNWRSKHGENDSATSQLPHKLLKRCWFTKYDSQLKALSHKPQTSLQILPSQSKYLYGEWENGIEWQSKGRKQRVSPVLRSCFGATAWTLQSWGYETKKIKVEKMWERKKERGKEKEKRGQETQGAWSIFFYIVYYMPWDVLWEGLRAFWEVLELSLCPWSWDCHHAGPQHLHQPSVLSETRKTRALEHICTPHSWAHRSSGLKAKAKACKSAEEQQCQGSNSHYPVPPE